MSTEKHPKRNVLDDVFLGVGAGLAIAAVLCLYVGILYLLRGPEPFESYDTTIGVVMVSYLSGGIAAGVVVGILLPLTRWRWGAVFVGFVVAMPVFAVIRVAEAGLAPWSRVDGITMVIFAATLGSITGWSYWGIFRRG